MKINLDNRLNSNPGHYASHTFTPMLYPLDYFPLGEIVSNNPALLSGVRGKAVQFHGVDQYTDLGTHEYVTA